MRLQTRESGVSLTEYAILLTLVATISGISLKLMGTSMQGLHTNVGDKLLNNSTLSLLENGAGKMSTKASSPFKGGGYYSLDINSSTGKPTLKLVDTSNAGVKNASSLEGTKLNTLGSFLLGQQIEQLAEQQTDPELREYYSRIAKLTYYLGANEGEIDDVDGFTKGNAYSNGDALRDLLAKKSELEELLKNPPSNLDPAEAKILMPLAVDAYNIAQAYANHLEGFVDDQGRVTRNFSTTKSIADENGQQTRTYATGAGSVLNEDTVLGYSNINANTRNIAYESLVPYETLKQQTKQMLSVSETDKNISNPVVATLTDATTIDNRTRNYNGGNTYDGGNRNDNDNTYGGGGNTSYGGGGTSYGGGGNTSYGGGGNTSYGGGGGSSYGGGGSSYGGGGGTSYGGSY